MRAFVPFGLALLVATAAFAANPPSPEEALRQAQKNGTPMGTVTPVFSQLVRFAVPANFHGVTQATKGNFFILEMVPLGETKERWTQMITLTGIQGMATAPNATPRAVASNIGGGFQKACPETFAAGLLGPLHTGGNEPQEGFALLSSCGSVKAAAGDHSETSLIIAIKGTNDYYTLQWAERGPGQAGKIELKDPKWLSRLSSLGPIVLCPIVPGEKAPYPSCTEQK